MSDTVWIIIETAIDYYQGFIMCFFIYRSLMPRNERAEKILLPIFAAAFGSAVLILNRISVYEGAASAIYILLLFAYSAAAFRDKYVKKLLASVIPVAVLLLVTTIELNLISSIKGISLTELIYSRGALRLLTLLIIQVSVAGALMLILKMFR